MADYNRLGGLNASLLYQRMRDAAFSRASRIPGIAIGLAKATINTELRMLRNDVDAAMLYLSDLPEQTINESAYEFFAYFFPHYLPKKFLRHYIYAKGVQLTLSEKEMVDCNPYITVFRCKAFASELTRIEATKKPARLPLQLKCPAGALTNGTLGQFTVNMDAQIDFRAKDDWKIAGTMNFYDEWDFDPKDFSTGGRSLQGELKTRFANYTLPGDGFKIKSESVSFSQSSEDTTVIWQGGEPVATPDRLSQIDIELKNAE